MQVILIEDVYDVGKRGQVIDVAKGFGRNYLLPKRLAVMATPGNLKAIDQQKVALAKKESKFRDEAEILAGELNQLHLIVSRKSGESGALFGSVTAKDLVELLKKEGIRLDRRKVRLDHPLKSIGNYRIPIHLHSEVTAELLVSVMVEGDQPVLRVKKKDAASDAIVRELNAKVRELGLPDEGRILEERFGPEPVAKAEATQEAPPEAAAPESATQEPVEALAAEPADQPESSAAADSNSEEGAGEEAAKS